MKILTKEQTDQRDMLIFGEPYDPAEYSGGTRHFERMDLKTAKELISLEFMDPEQGFNDAPLVKEFVEFMEDHEGFTAHGFTVSPDRSDCRTEIEGLIFDGGYSREDLADFIQAFKDADELMTEQEHLYCWYD